MDELKDGLWNVLAQHGARAITSSLTPSAVARPSGVKRAAEISSIICCDLTLNEDTLMRVAGSSHRDVAAE